MTILLFDSSAFYDRLMCLSSGMPRVAVSVCGKERLEQFQAAASAGFATRRTRPF